MNIYLLPCDVGMSNCAPWIPWTSWPEARINCGIPIGCWAASNDGSELFAWLLTAFVKRLVELLPLFVLVGAVAKTKHRITTTVRETKSKNNSLPAALTLRFNGPFIAWFPAARLLILCSPAARDATFGRFWRLAKFCKFWRVTIPATERKRNPLLVIDVRKQLVLHWIVS